MRKVAVATAFTYWMSFLLLAPGAVRGQDRTATHVTDLRGGIGVAAAEHVCAIVKNARAASRSPLVVRIDTPGGLLAATRDLVQCILAARRPVVVFVTPSGARAASAGTYIAQAAHVVAMTPGTHIGAATPVTMGGQGRSPPAGQPQSRPASEQKAINDAVAYLKGLAELRGRNIGWAEKAVREAATLTASEALSENVVDVLARDLDDLLRQIDGREVTIDGQAVSIASAGGGYTVVHPPLRLRFLAAIAGPNIAFVLLMIGIYGILLEFWSPGALVPGVIGGISLLLAMTALSVLPVSYGALALVLLGIALMTAEAIAPGFGVLGLGGLGAFVTGAIFLFDRESADFDLQIAWPVIISAAATAGLLSVVVLASALRARDMDTVTGAEELIGSIGEVAEWGGHRGTFHVHGEIWIAHSSRELPPGTRARVVSRNGLTLSIEPVSANERLQA